MICTFGMGDEIPRPQNKIWEKKKRWVIDSHFQKLFFMTQDWFLIEPIMKKGYDIMNKCMDTIT